MSLQYAAFFPNEDGSVSFWVFDGQDYFIKRMLELLARERLDAWDSVEDPPPEVEARVKSFCAMTAPLVEASGRLDAGVFWEALDAAFPLAPDVFPSRADGLYWAGPATDLLNSEHDLLKNVRDDFKIRHGAQPTIETLDQFIEFLLAEWP